MQDWTHERTMSPRHNNFYNFSGFKERDPLKQRFAQKASLNQSRISTQQNNLYLCPITIQVRNVSVEIRPKHRTNKSQFTQQRQDEYYKFQTLDNSAKENQNLVFRRSMQKRDIEQQNANVRRSVIGRVQRNFFYETINDSQIRKSLKYQQESIVQEQKHYQKDQDETGDKLEKKNTIDTQQDTNKNRQQILEDIQKRFKTPHKIQDLLNYLSSEFNCSSEEKNLSDKNTLLSSQKSTQENWFDNTADSFNSTGKNQKKFSLVNKTYSQFQECYGNKFDLKFYSVFDKLNQRQQNNISQHKLQEQLNEFKTKIDYIDTQKFLKEVKESLSQKDVNFYVNQLKKK